MTRHRWFFLGGAGVALAVIFSAAALFSARPGLFSGDGGDHQCRVAAAVSEALANRPADALPALQVIDPVDLRALPFDATTGKVRTIGDLDGQLMVFNLWATWCAPCREEMPYLAALQRERGGSDLFEVVAVSIDNRDDNRPENFLAETNAINLAYHREPTLALFNSLRGAGLLVGMPTTYIIAPDGCAAASLAGAADWSSPGALAAVDIAIAAIDSRER